MRVTLSRLDLLLLVMTLIWGSNFSILKAALRQLPPTAFNGVRMLIAAALCAVIVSRQRDPDGSRPRLTPIEWRRLVVLAIIGHFAYQILFIGGVARTSASNSSLIFGCTPAIVALLSAWLGHERITPMRWAGLLLSVAGVYLVVGHGHDPGASLTGDALIVVAMIAWAIYTVGSRPLLDRHSPVVVTGYGMMVGGCLYCAAAAPAMLRIDWSAVPAGVWVAIIYSAVFSLVVAYLIWYTGVQRVGSSRTSVYSNLTPIVAMVIAAVSLGEPITMAKAAGAAAVLGGVALTRLEFGTGATAPSES